MNVSKSFLQLLRWVALLGLLWASGDISSLASEPPLKQLAVIPASLDVDASASNTAVVGDMPPGHQTVVEASLDHDAAGLIVCGQPFVLGEYSSVPSAVFLEVETGVPCSSVTPAGRLRHTSAQARAPPATVSAS